GGAIACGGASPTVTTGTPGQNASLTFDGRAGQRASLKIATTISSAYVSILNPDGSVLTPNTYVSPSGGFLDPRTLPAAGTYRILIDPQGAATGSTTLTLYDVPPDVTASITPGGAPLSISAGTPGQNARITFDGHSGGRTVQPAPPHVPGVGVLTSYLPLLKPDAPPLPPSTTVTTSGRTIPADLPSDGTYAITIDPLGSETGMMTLTLS